MIEKPSGPISPDIPTKVGGFVVKHQLGKGAFGYVYYGEHESTEEKVAIKFVDREKINQYHDTEIREKKLRLMHDESRLMQLCRSQHVVHCFGTFSLDRYEVLMLEYCDGPNLRDYIRSKEAKRLELAEALNILQQLACGFAELHRHNIIHRDVKSYNVFSNHGMFKIGDLGLARIMGNLAETTVMTIVGTRDTMAPEVYGEKYGVKADIYSLGAVLYEMVHGYSAFRGSKNGFHLQQRVRRGDYHIDSYLVGNEYAVRLIERMMKVDYNYRISWSELHRHPLVAGVTIGCSPRDQTTFYDSLELMERDKLVTNYTQKFNGEKSNAQIELQRRIEEQLATTAEQYLKAQYFELHRVRAIIANGIEPFTTEKIVVSEDKYVEFALMLAIRCQLRLQLFKQRFQQVLTDVYERVRDKYVNFDNLFDKVVFIKNRLKQKLDEQRSPIKSAMKILIGIQEEGCFEQASLTDYSLFEQMEYTLYKVYPVLRKAVLDDSQQTQHHRTFLNFMREYVSVVASEYPMDHYYLYERLPKLLSAPTH